MGTFGDPQRRRRPPGAARGSSCGVEGGCTPLVAAVRGRDAALRPVAGDAAGVGGRSVGGRQPRSAIRLRAAANSRSWDRDVCR
jgi:hypothetical protein